MDVDARPQPPYVRAPEGVLDARPVADGQELVRRHWALPGASRAVLLVHGLGEHSGRYRHVAAWFNARGYDALGYDQRGHGLSRGPRGALSRSDDLLTDLAAVYADYAARAPALPLLLGHSMGGLVAARAVLDGRVAPAALVLSSPAFRSHEARWLQSLAAGLARALPNLPLRTGLAVDRLSHDASVAAAYRHDPLCSARITPRLADFIFRAGPSCIADASRLTVPTLLLAAGADRLVDAAGSREFAAAAWATGRLTARHFDTLYHELFNEAEPARSQVMKQLGDWLARLPG
ncbi:alpha/beta hydrolase [Dyella sp. KRB-257]|uniref:alpha/beta hydrolase n=1 Tax=Dyella sp. KRB-257 TaxID=3400915 RepID=UPI003BFFD0BD